MTTHRDYSSSATLRRNLSFGKCYRYSGCYGALWGISMIITSWVVVLQRIEDVEAFLTTSVTRSRNRSLLPRQATTTTIVETTPTATTTVTATATATTLATTPPTNINVNTGVLLLDWSFLDGVYLIHCSNGDPEGTRLTSTTNVLKYVNLLDGVSIKEFETDDENRVRGCYTSHLSIYREVLRQEDLNTNDNDHNKATFPTHRALSNNRHVLILEDNLALNRKVISHQTLDSIATFLQSNQDWDVMHLAYIPYVPHLKVSTTTTTEYDQNNDIVKLSTGIGSALGTTAYIINTPAMKRLVQEDDSNGGYHQLPIPDVMAKVFGESRYASNPTLFVRAPTTKSLVNPQLDDLREILFQPVVTDLAQRLLVITGLSTNTLLPMIVVALLIASIASIQTSVYSVVQYCNTGSLDGHWVVPLFSIPLSLCSLALIVQGAILAPKPQPTDTSET
jgi:hypothetical protein